MPIVLLLQIAIFLFLSPIVMAQVGEGLNYHFGISFVFLVAFLAGLLVGKSRAVVVPASSRDFAPLFPSWAKILLICWTIFYISVVVSNDLVFRRQGSEVMAVLYSGLSISDLMILRGYEISFFPLTIAMIASLAFDKSRLVKISLFALFLGFLFMGVADSRAKLLMPILFYYMVFQVSARRQARSPKLYLYLSGVVLAMAVLLVGMGRTADYDGVFWYFVHDLVKRTDGLELISMVNEEVDIPIYGTLDIRIFVNFVSMIPFLSEAEVLKAIGLTSSKNFLLREILGLPAFDMNNSVVADLYYFGGYIGVVVGAIVYGYFTGKFDSAARTARVWASRGRAAFLLAFMMNAFRIEVDYFSMTILVIRDFVIIYLLLFTVRFVSNGFFKQPVATAQTSAAIT